MNRAPLNIETLLQQIGSVDVPEDTAHRYELRRELLCSKFFGDRCAREQRWNRVLTFTAPLITGGLLVVVFSFVGSSLYEPSTAPIAPIAAGHSVVAQAELTEDFVDERPPVPLYEVIKFVPVEAANYVLMR